MHARPQRSNKAITPDSINHRILKTQLYEPAWLYHCIKSQNLNSNFGKST